MMVHRTDIIKMMVGKLGDTNCKLSNSRHVPRLCIYPVDLRMLDSHHPLLVIIRCHYRIKSTGSDPAQNTDFFWNRRLTQVP